MTMTIDLSPETEAHLEREAAQRGQQLADYTRQSFEIWLSLSTKGSETEEEAFAEMRALSLPTLEDYWINDHDAIYDTTFLPGEDTQAWITRLRQIDSERPTQTLEASKIRQI